MFSTKTCELTAKILETDPEKGISYEQAEERRQKYGPNCLDRRKEKGIAEKLLYQFSDPMIIILIIAAGVSFLTGLLEGKVDFIDPVIIISIVCINAGIGVFQESRAEKSLEALKEMLSPEARVRRNGETVDIPADELVPGDVLIIESGDIIPADCRLIKSVNLTMDEAALTGEAYEIGKNSTYICAENTPLGDRKNMVWSATTVSAGRGEGIVTATGMNTEVGKIAGSLINEAAPSTPLQKRLEKTGKILGLSALAICGVIFIMGILRAIPPVDIFLTAVSLAVAAIPEGLPAIVTIMLASGVRRMADHSAIVRRLSAVETLGSASVICTDKTGTVTKNQMEVVRWWGNEKKSALCAVLCSNGVGATEEALLKSAAGTGYERDDMEKIYPRISESPFNSSQKWMGTVNHFSTGSKCFIKGAPDAVMRKCSLSVEEKRRIIKENDDMAGNALRVIAFAEGEGSEYRDMKFLGMAGLADPVRPEAKDAIETCRNAGIKVVMITGDHEKTAAAVAAEAGLVNSGEAFNCITGIELKEMSDKELEEKAESTAVFARVAPEDKVRIVKAFQRNGHVAAMTGDGVNDAPALRIADIGCAMGIGGTAVAREAADIILADDNFSTIVTAVREGRGIYDNIKKAAHFLLSGNIGEIITVFTAILMGWNSPLLPVQLLWINLITDSFPALALGMDPPEKNIMKRNPVKKNPGLFEKGMAGVILTEGIMIGTLALFAFAVGCNYYHSEAVGRTMSFTVLTLSQLFHALNVRSEEKSLFSTGLLTNIYLTGALCLCCIMQIAVVMMPVPAQVFKVVPLSGIQWIIVTALSVFPMIFVESEKLIMRILKKTE